MRSQEFESLYGAAPNDDTFVNLLYQNVLERAPEDAGRQYWTEKLNGDELSREAALVYFAESPENKALTSADTALGVTYVPWEA